MFASVSPPPPISPQNGKFFVVTGANAGLGFETAKALGTAGAHVILACRSEIRGNDAVDRLRQEAGNGVYEFMKMDLADLDSVKEFVEELKKKFTHIDCLINNAGVMWPPFGKTKQGFETTFHTNHLGHFALTILMLPLLESSGKGRVVPISSIAADWKGYAGMMWDNLNAEKTYNHHYAYGQSKLANLLFAFELEKRLRATNSTVQCIAAHPGSCNTELLRYSVFSRFGFLAMPPTQGCLSFLHAATSDTAKGGEYYGPHGFIHAVGYPTKLTPPVRALDTHDAEKLWKLSEEMTGVAL
eukprot:TRINITY_DN30507_c0_g1_i1.p1 TRINITY_DN30507_c0_g1~~TRINITY_DN30507_c0_g1_i1.p1  ORF type:complete len:300 (+),score=48.05 TRINITY_DN30507_c0_g1_i1:51-950(+)